MRGFWFGTSCPDCGTEFEFATGRQTGPASTEADVRCPNCCQMFVTVVKLYRKPEVDRGCGSREGYLQHVIRKETACVACRNAQERWRRQTA
jgi:predicted Zn finger-like uncharacterized protein